MAEFNPVPNTIFQRNSMLIVHETLNIGIHVTNILEAFVRIGISYILEASAERSLDSLVLGEEEQLSTCLLLAEDLGASFVADNNVTKMSK